MSGINLLEHPHLIAAQLGIATRKLRAKARHLAQFSVELRYNRRAELIAQSTEYPWSVPIVTYHDIDSLCRVLGQAAARGEIVREHPDITA